jgi:hypothetical protein
MGENVITGSQQTRSGWYTMGINVKDLLKGWQGEMSSIVTERTILCCRVRWWQGGLTMRIE